MLAFRSAINASITAIIPAEAILFTYGAISNSSWTFTTINSGNKVVKGSAQASAGTTAGAGTWTTTSATDTNTDGDHTGSVLTGYLAYENAGTTFQTIAFHQGSNGTHTHAWSGINLASSYPPYYAVGTYKSNGTLTLLPINTIIFSASNPNTSLWTAASAVNAALENKSIYTPALAASIGTTGGSLSNTVSLTSSTSGSHNHPSSANGLYRTASSSTNRSNIVANGSHSHTGQTLSMTLSQQYMKLNTWINQTSTAPIVSGMIIAYGSTSVSIPTDWYVCNGQTVKGVTTPNLVSRYVRFTSTSHGNIPTNDGLVDLNQYSGSATFSVSASHTHFAGTTRTGFAQSYYHNTLTWTHSHTLSVTDSYEPPSTNLTFIMYIP